MSWVEGIGDEVIEFFFALLVITIGTVAWWSTRISEIPAFRTVLVFERRSRTHTLPDNVQNQSSNTVITSDQASQSYSTNTSEENKPPSASASTSVETNNTDGASGDATTDATPEELEQNTIIHNMDSYNLIRRRRVAFFDQQDTPSGANNEENSSQTEHNTSPVENKEENPVENKEVVESENNVFRVEEIHPTASTTVEDNITIKLKYINDDLKLVNGNLKEHLGEFKRRHFQLELTSNKIVKLIFNGQVLQRDEMTLQGCGLFDNCVVHCLVHQKRTNTMDPSNVDGTVNADIQSAANISRTRVNGGGSREQPREWDLGNLFFIIVSFFLGAAWYFRYEYAQLYTVTATMALVGLTGIFTVLLVGMYFPDPEPAGT